jgi:hypothetical protein
MEVIVSWILGALAAMGIAMLVEWLRKPKLLITVEIPPLDWEYLPGRPVQRARYVRVIVENRQPQSFLRWIRRDAALQCEGEVTFFRLNGQNFFGRPMPGRWVDSPEPPAPTMAGTMGGQPITLHNPSLWNVMAWELRRIDIYPGRPRLLDVAARFDGDAECYGWTNANYFSEPAWRNPEWRLPGGLYLVRVKVDADSGTVSKTFLLTNDTPVQSFRLEPAPQGDPLI